MIIFDDLQGKDLAYWERNQLVAYLSKEFQSWLELHPKEDTSWENDWRNKCSINVLWGGLILEKTQLSSLTVISEI